MDPAGYYEITVCGVRSGLVWDDSHQEVQRKY